MTRNKGAFEVDSMGGRHLEQGTLKISQQMYIFLYQYVVTQNKGAFEADSMERSSLEARGGGLGSRPKKMYGERLGDGVEYHLMKPTPCR